MKVRAKLYDKSVNFFTHITSEEAGHPPGLPSVLVEVQGEVAAELHQGAVQQARVAGLLRGQAAESEAEPSGP